MQRSTQNELNLLNPLLDGDCLWLGLFGVLFEIVREVPVQIKPFRIGSTIDAITSSLLRYGISVGIEGLSGKEKKSFSLKDA